MWHPEGATHTSGGRFAARTCVPECSTFTVQIYDNTALCLQKLAATTNQQVVLPADIKPYVFTNLAWDNIDRLEETLTGMGTSHRVNGIAVQPKIFGPHLPERPLPNIKKQKQRTVSTENQELPIYFAGERVGPQPITTKTSNVEDNNEASKVARDKNMIWVLARQVDTQIQKIPSWTGFNIITRDLVAVTEDVIGYLPTINAPATEHTVFEIWTSQKSSGKSYNCKQLW